MSRRRLHQRQRRHRVHATGWWRITNGPQELLCSPTQNYEFAIRMADLRGARWRVEPAKGPRS